MLVYLCRYCCAIWFAMVHIQMKCNHLEKIKESYFVHLGFTIRVAVGLLFVAFVSVIHGLFPFILTNSVSKQISDLNDRLKER